jgi:hypothetical protein
MTHSGIMAARPAGAARAELHVLGPKSSPDPGSSWVDPRTYRVTACRMIGNLNTACRHTALAGGGSCNGEVDGQREVAWQHCTVHCTPRHAAGQGGFNMRAASLFCRHRPACSAVTRVQHRYALHMHSSMPVSSPLR